MIPAGVTGVSRPASDAVMLALYSAMNAKAAAIGPALVLDVFEAGVFIWKFAVELFDSVFLFWLDRLIAVHRLSFRVGCASSNRTVKGACLSVSITDVLEICEAICIRKLIVPR